MKRAILILTIVCAGGCKGPQSEPSSPEPPAHVEPTPDLARAAETRNESGSLEGAVLTPRGRAVELGARLSPEPTRTKALEGVSAEGASASIWERNGEIVKVVLEFKGETYDRVHTVYLEHGKPFFARLYEHFDPAKFMSDTDEGYDEAVAARYIEIFLVTYEAGNVDSVETAKIETREGATYDQGNLVEEPVPATEPIARTDNGFDAVHSSTHELLSKL